jgi:hypothetical protein
MGGCEKVDVVCGDFSFVEGKRTRDFAFVSLRYERSGEEMCTGICHGRQRPNAI